MNAGASSANVAVVLEECRQRGVDLWFEGTRLRFRAPPSALTPELRQQIGAHRESILAHLRGVAAATIVHSPLSHTQRSLWIVQQQAPASTAYHIPLISSIRGTLNLAALRHAMQAIVDRHASLRTTYELNEGVPRARVPGFRATDIEVRDVSGRDDSDVRALIDAEVRVRFDLEQGPVIRAVLFTRAPDEHVLVTVVHHMAMDGHAASIVSADFAKLYTEEAGGPPAALGPVEHTYADYTEWQTQMLEGPEGERLWEYWSQQLALPREVVELPLDHGRSTTPTFRGATHRTGLDREMANEVRHYARAQRVTPFVVLFAAFTACLHRWSGATDVIVGTPFLGRTREEFARVVGAFMNVLPIRAPVAEGATFPALIASLGKSVRDALDAQDMPLTYLVERLRPVREANRAPLFDTLFQVTNTALADEAGAARVAVPGAEITPFPRDTQEGQADLALHVLDNGDTLEFEWHYNPDLLERATAVRMADGYTTLLLDAIRREEATPIATLAIVSVAEELKLAAWNATAAPFSNAPLHELIALQAAQSPSAIAVSCGDVAVTYEALETRASRIAHVLREYGAGPGVLVGVALERSTDLVAALLGVLKTGSAYVPIDPSLPADRVSYIIGDAGVSIVLTHSSLRDTIPQTSARVFEIDTGGAVIDHAPASTPPSWSTTSDVAYVIYTSGSTGRPKGVAVTHASLVNLLESMRAEPGFGPGDVLAAVTTISFDIAGLEIFLPLVSGGRVDIIRRDESLDATRLGERLRQAGVTVMQATPATWTLLVQAQWNSAPGFRAWSGGDVLPADLAVALSRRTAQTWNLYGPTETTIWSTVAQVQPGTTVTIGRPIANTQVHILDALGQRVPIGVVGEIWIGGAGVAAGYHRHPELTSERFVDDPFSAQRGARLYRTGDRGRWTHDGNLEHLGRLDYQVKVRGFRVELGEIETVIKEMGVIRETAVIVREDRPGDQRLVAYIVPDAGAAIADDDIRRHLSARLPAYMIPGNIVRLPALPLTYNGKLDRKALPAPEPASRTSVATSAVMTPAQRRVAATWQEILGVGAVGLHDNFFDLGGHSLLVVQLHAALQREFSCNIPLVELFQRTTVATQADRVAPVRATADSPLTRAKARAARLLSD